MSGTLYQRLGGAERIAAIIEDSIDRHAVNPSLASRLRGKDLPRLKALGLQIVCTGMDLSERELAAAADDIVAALKDQGVGERELSDLVAILNSLRKGKP
jgi:hemoglobin